MAIFVVYFIQNGRYQGVFFVKLIQRWRLQGRLHMVPANMHDKFVIRFCVCAQNAIEEDIFTAWGIIKEHDLVYLDFVGSKFVRAISIAFQSTYNKSSKDPKKVILLLKNST